jgi:pSer/pThr/pTyr-binding forkhead associated (FHA) protein
MVICPDCHEENPPQQIACISCGEDLYESLIERVPTRRVNHNETRDMSPGIPSSSRPIIFYIGKEQQPIAVNRMNVLFVGRCDPSKSGAAAVDVDMSNFDGQLQGVSRRHLRIDAKDAGLTVTDLDSFNGTFINGERLVSGQPYPLHSGDELSLGRLVMRVFYR